MQDSNIATMTNTLEQYHNIVSRCKDLYVKKAKDYGVGSPGTELEFAL